MPLSIILEDETSGKQCKAILSTIASSGKQLKHWAEVLNHLFPQYVHNIPTYTSMNIGKLGSGSAISSDTFDGARTTSCLLVQQVQEAAAALNHDNSTNIIILEQDC
eukprot:13661516-Ditylum_brightwellii.AAC.1